MKLETNVREPFAPAPGAPDLVFPVKGVSVEGTDDGCRLGARVVIQDGRLVISALRVDQVDGGPPITSEVTRGLPLAAILTLAAADGLLPASAVEDGSVVRDLPLFEGHEVTAAKAAGPVDSTLRLVARAYRVGLMLDQKPTQTVAEVFQVPRSTAGRWVATARAAGHLAPAAGPGKAGG